MPSELRDAFIESCSPPCREGGRAGAPTRPRRPTLQHRQHTVKSSFERFAELNGLRRGAAPTRLDDDDVTKGTGLELGRRRCLLEFDDEGGSGEREMNEWNAERAGGESAPLKRDEGEYEDGYNDKEKQVEEKTASVPTESMDISESEALEIANRPPSYEEYSSNPQHPITGVTKNWTKTFSTMFFSQRSTVASHSANVESKPCVDVPAPRKPNKLWRFVKFLAPTNKSFSQPSTFEAASHACKQVDQNCTIKPPKTPEQRNIRKMADAKISSEDERRTQSLTKSDSISQRIEAVTRLIQVDKRRAKNHIDQATVITEAKPMTSCSTKRNSKRPQCPGSILNKPRAVQSDVMPTVTSYPTRRWASDPNLLANDMVDEFSITQDFPSANQRMALLHADAACHTSPQKSDEQRNVRATTLWGRIAAAMNAGRHKNVYSTQDLVGSVASLE